MASDSISERSRRSAGLDRTARGPIFCHRPNSADGETEWSTERSWGDATDRDIYKALADPTRRRILALLRERDMTAGELAGRFELAWPTMSGHFSVLREAGLVQADRTGSTITYRLNVTVLQESLMALMDAFGIEPRRGPR
jgi:DNA-binding transcriptional ArsR family regulator